MPIVNIVNTLGLIVCLVVMIGCICRLALLDPRHNRQAWGLLFVLFGSFAAGVACDLARGSTIEWYEAAGMAGVLLKLLLTMEEWPGRPPKRVDKHRLRMGNFFQSSKDGAQ